MQVLAKFLLFACACAVSHGSARYDYQEALSKSLLFYMAQRSGHLTDHVIPWRGDSALQDGSDVHRDLTGGWYDAGDFLKLNFPMAASTTNLLWGLLHFQDAYVTSGQLTHLQEVVKWPLDYFLRCWDADSQVFYGQVGKVSLDHDFWGRPEDMTMARPTYKLTTSHPGSDLAGETAAAMAAGYLAFKTVDQAFANKLLSAARSLYTFADSHHGLYHHSIPDAADAYPSYGFQDELCWGAAWLYKATGETTYLQKAEQALSRNGADSNEFSWDDKAIGCVVVLHELSQPGSAKRSDYENLIRTFLHKWRNGNGGIHITPCGLSFLSKWGSLRYAMNAALIAMIAAEQGVEPQANRKWAISQLNYALGDNKYGRSFEVGFGVNPPVRPHHAASSCRSPPAPCDWSDYDKADPNPHILNGALVGGPDNQDNYNDVRTDYVMNEVTCDYNAGFQSVLAGAVSLESRAHFPDVQQACPQQRTNQGGNTGLSGQHSSTTTHAPASSGADLDCHSFGTHRHHATGTAYYPAPSEGGVMDMNDHHLQTLQDYLDGNADYVSVGMDDHAGIQYGTPLCIPELNHKYSQVILFKVVDTGPEFRNRGYTRINICVKNHHATLDDTINGPLTLVFQ